MKVWINARFATPEQRAAATAEGFVIVKDGVPAFVTPIAGADGTPVLLVTKELAPEYIKELGEGG